MKGDAPEILISSRPARPFPDKEILWGSQEGGQSFFPTSAAAYERKNSSDPAPLESFCRAVSEAQERVWIVDEYLLIPDNGKSTKRIEQVVNWFPLWFSGSDVRLLTAYHHQINEGDLKRFQRRAQEINDRVARRERECRIELRVHLKRDCNFIHDRFAIIDDELWHFGGTVGGFHSRVSAASRGWRATDHNAISFFEEIWDSGRRR